jgi:hypothetical protein
MAARFEVLKEDSGHLGYVTGPCNTEYYIFFIFKRQAVRKVRNLLVTSLIGSLQSRTLLDIVL